MERGDLSKMGRLALFWAFCSLFLFSIAKANPSGTHRENPTLRDLTETIQIAWFTKNEKRLFPGLKKASPNTTHAEIIAEGRAYSSTGRGANRRYIDRGPLNSQRTQKDVVLFHLRVTKSELRNIVETIREGNPNEFLANCVQSTLFAIKKATGFHVPFPASHSPLLTSLYLFSLKALGNVRISKIEFVGTPFFKQLLSKDVLFEGTVASLGMAIIAVTPPHVLHQGVSKIETWLKNKEQKKK